MAKELWSAAENREWNAVVRALALLGSLTLLSTILIIWLTFAGHARWVRLVEAFHFLGCFAIMCYPLLQRWNQRNS